MPRFVDESQVKVVRAEWWGAEETCTIKRFSYGDRQFLAGQTVAVGIKPGADDDAIADVQIAKMNLATLERGIVAWTDVDGKSMSVTREMIEQLEEDDADFILEELSTLNPRRRRAEAEQATFRGEPRGGATA